MSMAIGLPANARGESTLDTVLEDVLKKHQRPEDRYEIAAILEWSGSPWRKRSAC
ncbi:MAG: hypothetical protein K0R75_2085 [Paenibacillaceae bacterium]|nr:hypothetical protein [Paenibacillaceae bacterium]